MKRILALSLMLVLVFSMGAMAQVLDYDIGTLEEDNKLDIEVEFTVRIDKYARVWLRENKLFKGSLLGQAGLYTSDEDQVIDLATGYFGYKFDNEYWPETGFPWMGLDEDADEGYDRNGGALFRIESNCDANVDVDFEWDDKLNSELVLWVFRHESTDAHPKYPPVNGYPDDFASTSRISTKSETDPHINFAHDYEDQHEEGREYKIGGALFIDFISQQEAADYTGIITITVSAADDEPAL